MVEIQPIDAAASGPLRQRILRPHQTLEELRHQYEVLPETEFFGALINGEVVGTAVVFPEPRSGSVARHPWRLVAMAVDPSFQRAGIGRRLLESCFAYIRENGGDEVWCHARTIVAQFYENCGFHREGAVWMDPHTGEHVLMWQSV